MAHATEAARRGGLFDFIRSVFADLREDRKRIQLFHRTHDELSSMSDRDLADIGVHRSEIGRIAREAAGLR